MTFKELRQNNQIHILDKREGAKYTLGKVLNVSQPRFDMPNMAQPGTMQQMTMPNMVVDVTVEANGKTETFKFPENASMYAVGSTLYSIEKDGIVRELDATIAQCEQYFADQKKMRTTLEQSKTLKSELDSTYRERQETEERFASIEKNQHEMGEKLDRILEQLKLKK